MGLVCESNLEFLFNLFAKEMSMVRFCNVFNKGTYITTCWPPTHYRSGDCLSHLHPYQNNCKRDSDVLLIFQCKIIIVSSVAKKSTGSPHVSNTSCLKFVTKLILTISKKIIFNISGVTDAFFGEMNRNIGEIFRSKPISARTDVTEARSTYCEIIFLWRILGFQAQILRGT